MEYRSISAKLPVNELTMFKSFCEKKGITPASLIRKLILQELKVPIPHTVAGKNRISYNKKDDSFIWSIDLDRGEPIEILKNVSPSFIENLHEIITLGMKERYTFINKKKKDSVAVPNGFLKGRI